MKNETISPARLRYPYERDRCGDCGTLMFASDMVQLVDNEDRRFVGPYLICVPCAAHKHPNAYASFVGQQSGPPEVSPRVESDW